MAKNANYAVLFRLNQIKNLDSKGAMKIEIPFYKSSKLRVQKDFFGIETTEMARLDVLACGYYIAGGSTETDS